MIRSVLVANRGEIALRVMRTCRRLGIQTAAVFSDADRTARHVQAADEAYGIGPAPAVESYLNQAVILEVAQRAQVEAIHPGYGFLAENADFAESVLAAGLIWIGPPPSAMRLLGEKAPAKALAEQHGVPVLPGYHGDDQRPEVLAERARELGFPLLIKASAGGGGRGMRVVDSPEGLLDALAAAQREARASFGNDQVLLERYVQRPRHIEVQVFGDAYGNVVHLGERECSIQRRHQKLVEESPSPAVDAALRDRLGSAAVTLAQAAGYQNAGTVEFLMDGQGSFYFLELNARLQVEHPVTEMVTGLDLVELQLQVAAGEPLPLCQDDIQLRGHAIEARIIAEDPLAGFLPSTGHIDALDLAADAQTGVRVDSGFGPGSEVSPYYDSLLAKLIVHAESRPVAIATLAGSLREAHIEGPRTNLDLLLAIAELPAFQVGALHTGFLEEHRVIESLRTVPAEVLAAVSAVRCADNAPAHRAGDPWRMMSAWRPAGIARPLWWQHGTESIHVRLTPSADQSFRVEHEDQVTTARLVDTRHVLIHDRIATVLPHAAGLRVEWLGRSYKLAPAPPLEVGESLDAADSRDGALVAPMPGRVVKLHVTQSQSVTAHQPLLVLEAMKMEHVVTAPRAGTVTELHVREGQQVQGGAVLIAIEER